MAVAVLCASVLPVAAQEAYGSTGPFSKEFTHQYLDGATYRSRFTIEGAVGIQPDAQGVGEDHAYLVGYADPNYFSYVFKKQFGVSPSKYRGKGKA